MSYLQVSQKKFGGNGAINTYFQLQQRQTFQNESHFSLKAIIRWFFGEQMVSFVIFLVTLKVHCLIQIEIFLVAFQVFNVTDLSLSNFRVEIFVIKKAFFKSFEHIGQELGGTHYQLLSMPTANFFLFCIKSIASGNKHSSISHNNNRSFIGNKSLALSCVPLCHLKSWPFFHW